MSGSKRRRRERERVAAEAARQSLEQPEPPPHRYPWEPCDNRGCGDCTWCHGATWVALERMRP